MTNEYGSVASGASALSRTSAQQFREGRTARQTSRLQVVIRGVADNVRRWLFHRQEGAASPSRDEQMLMERISGHTLQAIGDRHGLTREGVRYVLMREADRHIDELAMKLLANTKTGELMLFAIPDHGGEGFDLAMDYFHWAMRELADRNIELEIHYRPTHNGIVFGVEDVSFKKKLTSRPSAHERISRGRE
jgi:hypothetical protein